MEKENSDIQSTVEAVEESDIVNNVKDEKSCIASQSHRCDDEKDSLLSDDDEYDDELELDEESDTETYKPSNEEVEDDDEESSGDEETGMSVEELSIGEFKMLKLKFDDVEAKRQEYLKQFEEMKDEAQNKDDGVESNKENETSEMSDNGTAGEISKKPECVDMHVTVDAYLEGYNSNDDDDFNPVYCGETLSDVEYEDGDERDTESEPEIDDQGGVHKKTGEALKCIRNHKIDPEKETEKVITLAEKDKTSSMDCV